MARIRSIKPEIWTDEKFVELSPLARLLFIGLWNFADDEGRMEFSATRIKLQILPADPADISALLGEIRGKDMVMIYEVDGKEYLQVTKFSKHQKVDKRNPSKYPAPRDVPPNPAEFPRISPPEGKGREGIKEGNGKIPASRRSPKTPIPDDYTVSDRMRSWAAENGVHNLDEHFAYFVNLAKAKDYRYADWDRALMNAVLGDWAKIGKGVDPFQPKKVALG